MGFFGFFWVGFLMPTLFCTPARNFLPLDSLSPSHITYAGVRTVPHPSQSQEGGGGDRMTKVKKILVCLSQRSPVLRILTFWCGSGSESGSADPCQWLMDPDPAIFVIDLQNANKKLNFLKIYIIFQWKKKSKRSHKAVGIKVFLTMFAWL